MKKQEGLHGGELDAALGAYTRAVTVAKEKPKSDPGKIQRQIDILNSGGKLLVAIEHKLTAPDGTARRWPRGALVGYADGGQGMAKMVPHGFYRAPDEAGNESAAVAARKFRDEQLVPAQTHLQHARTEVGKAEEDIQAAEVALKNARSAFTDAEGRVAVHEAALADLLQVAPPAPK